MNFKYRKKNQSRRALHRGYALLFVVFIAAIGGMAVLGISNTIRYETLEIEAKRKELADRHNVLLNAEKVKARAPAN